MPLELAAVWLVTVAVPAVALVVALRHAGRERELAARERDAMLQRLCAVPGQAAVQPQPAAWMPSPEPGPSRSPSSGSPPAEFETDEDVVRAAIEFAGADAGSLSDEDFDRLFVTEDEK